MVMCGEGVSPQSQRNLPSGYKKVLEVFYMVKITSFILSLAILAAGFLGLTKLLPIFVTYPVLANIGAIILGMLGLLILIYSGRGKETAHQRRENSQQREENIQLKKEASDQSKRENEQLKKDIDQLRMENEQQRNMIEKQVLQNSIEKDI